MAYTVHEQDKKGGIYSDSYRAAFQRAIIVGSNLLVDLNDFVVRRQE